MHLTAAHADADTGQSNVSTKKDVQALREQAELQQPRGLSLQSAIMNSFSTEMVWD
jgi:hypothetical protein